MAGLLHAKPAKEYAVLDLRASIHCALFCFVLEGTK